MKFIKDIYSERTGLKVFSWFCIAFSLVLTGCGGSDGGGDASPGAALELTATETFDEAGGSITVGSEDGETLELTIQQDSLVGDTIFTITSLGGSAFSISPEGVRLVPPALLRLTRPGGFEPDTHFAWKFGDENFFLPTRVVEGGLEAEIGLFGLGASDEALVFSASAVEAEAAEDESEDDTESPATLGLAILICSQQIADLQADLQASNNRNLDRAIVLANQLLVVSTQCEQFQLVELKTQTCAKFQAAFVNAQSVLVTDLASFHELADPLFAASGHAQILGLECADMDNLDALVDAKFNQLIDALRRSMDQTDFLDPFLRGGQFEALTDMQRQCQLLSLREETCERFSNSLYPRVLDLFRISAYQDCLEDGTALSLSQLRVADERDFDGRARFSIDDLEADILHCTDPHLNLTVFKNSTRVPEEIPELGVELESRGEFDARQDPFVLNHTKTVALSVPRSGSFTLDGDLRVPVCPDASLSTDALVAKIGTVELTRRPASGNQWTINTLPIEIILSRELPLAGLDPLSSTSFTVDLFREGSGCAGVFPASTKLYSINVEVLPFELAVVPAQSDVDVNATLDFSAELDDLATTQVTWQASSGSISTDGLFTAGSTPGTVTITATLQQDPRVAATAQVTVREVNAVQSFRLGGRIILDYSYTLSWDDTDAVCEFDGSGVSTCIHHRTGDLSGTARMEFDIETPTAVLPTNVNANLTQLVSSSGALTGTFNTESSETGNICERSFSITSPLSLQGTLGSTALWFVNLQDETLFLGERVSSSFFFDGAAGPSPFTSTLNAGCLGGPGTTSGSSASGNTTMLVSTPLGFVSGLAPADANRWTGSSTVQVVDQLCASHFDGPIFETGGLKWLSSDASQCALTVDISWDLQKIPL